LTNQKQKIAKLSLNRESLRILTPGLAKEIHGGTGNETTVSSFRVDTACTKSEVVACSKVGGCATVETDIC
jgi:hypothetical protein